MLIGKQFTAKKIAVIARHHHDRKRQDSSLIALIKRAIAFLISAISGKVLVFRLRAMTAMSRD